MKDIITQMPKVDVEEIYFNQLMRELVLSRQAGKSMRDLKMIINTVGVLKIIDEEMLKEDSITYDNISEKLVACAEAFMIPEYFTLSQGYLSEVLDVESGYVGHMRLWYNQALQVLRKAMKNRLQVAQIRNKQLAVLAFNSAEYRTNEQARLIADNIKLINDLKSNIDMIKYAINRMDSQAV